MRSYSRNSGLTSCEHTTSSDRIARSAAATARSCARVEVGVQQAHGDRVDLVGDLGHTPSNGSISRPRASSRPDTSKRRCGARAARAGRRTGRTATAAPGARSRSRRRSHGSRSARRARRAVRAARSSRPSCRARARRHRSRPSTASIARSTPRAGSSGVDATFATRPSSVDDVGERPPAVDPESHTPTLLRDQQVGVLNAC